MTHKTKTETRELVNWQDESRLGWQSGIVPSDNNEMREIENYERQNLTLGCLMRIANALERIADQIEGRK